MKIHLRTTVTGDNPTTLSQAKSHLRILHTDDDTAIAALIASAWDYVERQTGRAYRTQTCVLKLQEFPYSPYEPISLPRSPLKTLTSVSYLDVAGNLQTLADPITTSGTPTRIYPSVTASSWPTTQDKHPEPVTVTYVAGQNYIPDSVTHAVLLWLDLEYHQHQAPQAARIERRISAMLDPFRIRSRDLSGLTES